VIATFF